MAEVRLTNVLSTKHDIVIAVTVEHAVAHIQRLAYGWFQSEGALVWKW